MRRDETRDGIKLVGRAAALGALGGMLFAVFTNQGQFTPTGAYPRPRKEARPWPSPNARSSPPTSVTSTPTSPTPPKSDPTSGNTATPMATTHPQTGPTTTAPSTSTTQTATTGTSTPDPTTTTPSRNPTTTTEGAAVTTTSIQTPPPPGSDENTAQSIATDVQGIGLPHDDPWTLETLQRATALFGPEPDKLPGYWAGQRHYYPWPNA